MNMLYVLATKFEDGDPCDVFAVGYLSGMLGDKYLVMAADGSSFRPSGFARAEPITQEEGAELPRLFPQITDKPGPSVWSHLQAMRRRKAYGQPIFVRF